LEPPQAPLSYNVSGGTGPLLIEEIKKKLQEEIATLEYELRNELPKEILKARAHGDLKENAEYHAAKERQSFVDARLGQLRKRLSEMSMVDVSKIPHGRAGLGSTVVVLDVKKEEELTFYLVTSEEADAPNGRISLSSPIGRALSGREEGDSIKVASPGGARELEIITIKTIHDLEGKR
jgi:transcription elongation factor GreA